MAKKMNAKWVLSLATLACLPVWANPQGAVVRAGDACIEDLGAALEISACDRSVIDWNSFSIQSGELTRFIQPSAESAVLNRVTGPAISEILGRLEANGQVFLVNPQGVIIGNDAVIQTGSFYASTLNVSVDSFSSFADVFFSGNESGMIENFGRIECPGGNVALIGRFIRNQGEINAEEIGLAIGKEVLLQFRDKEHLKILVLLPETSPGSGISNAGELTAFQKKLEGGGGWFDLEGKDALQLSHRGGRVFLLAEDNYVEQSGRISVPQEGEIELRSKLYLGSGSLIAPNGKIAVSAKDRIIETEQSFAFADQIEVFTAEGGKVFTSGSYRAPEGTICLKASDMTLAAAQFDASGKEGGGAVEIGGREGYPVQTIYATYATQLKSDGGDVGDGGQITIYSDQECSFFGSVSAKGGLEAGNGGEVEVSGRIKLTYGGRSDLSAPKGQEGILFFDPETLIYETPVQYQLIDPNAGNGTGFGTNILPLASGNVAVSKPGDNLFGTNSGAAYLYNGSTGALISTLTGSQANDNVANFGFIDLKNGNYLIQSTDWINGAATHAGAVTWASGTTGVSGVVSATNSLVGSNTNDRVGFTGIIVLTQGNYVVQSPQWKNGSSAGAGAATWGSGLSGVSGTISASNSLVGTVGSNAIGETVIALTNGNYVLGSPSWNDGTGSSEMGAVTWGNGATGTVGNVGPSNSLVGNAMSDAVGQGLVALSNGNYVSYTSSWVNGSNFAAGAATWGNGTMVTTGTVSSANSLVGTNEFDGSSNAVYALTNGNYVVAFPNWANGAASAAGAVALGNGSSGTSGTISATNSLVGTASNDMVGSDVFPLSNGNYVVSSPNWANGATANVGAATFGNGTTGIVGPVTTSNSLYGTTANDQISLTGIIPLSQGNYVVSSPDWTNGAAADAGAATWGNGTTGVSGAVSASNSLVGSHTDDFIGAGIVALTNGNYVAVSTSWNDGIGAATWGNGATGTSGIVSSSNSLVGSVAGDGVGTSVTALTNGNYVVSSPSWSNGIISSAGAATWGNGASGVSGVVSPANSLVGGTADDQVSSNLIQALPNGNYVVSSPDWSDGATSSVGAATWGDGTIGISGLIDATNSLIGSHANDSVSSEGFIVGTLGDYLVVSSGWNPSGFNSQGAVTVGCPSAGISGIVSAANSLLGPGTASLNNMSAALDSLHHIAYAGFANQEVSGAVLVESGFCISLPTPPSGVVKIPAKGVVDFEISISDLFKDWTSWNYGGYLRQGPFPPLYTILAAPWRPNSLVFMDLLSQRLQRSE